jgi:hypothetical protein
MAISTSSYFSNSLVGVPQVGGDVDIYDSHSTPKYPIGQKYEREDGCVFRYVEFTAACSSNALVGTSLTENGTVWASANTCLAPSSTYQDPSEISGVYPGSLGSRFLISGITGSINQYAGAYLTLVKGTGSPAIYRIRGNDATSTTKTGCIKLSLYDKIKTAVDTSTSAMITGCRWNGIAQTTTAASTYVAAGATVTSATAATWGWVQSKGPCAVISSNVLTAGCLVTVGDTEGTVQKWATGTTSSTTQYAGLQPIVGFCVGVGSATAVNLISLTID